MEGRRERQASIHPTEAHSFVASKYCKWRKGSRPRKGSRSVAWLDGMVEVLVSARKAWEGPKFCVRSFWDGEFPFSLHRERAVSGMAASVLGRTEQSSPEAAQRRALRRGA